MQIEDLYVMLGELYVAQRTLQHEKEILQEQNNQMRIDGAELQQRLDETLVKVDEQAADIELLNAKLTRKRKGGRNA